MVRFMKHRKLGIAAAALSALLSAAAGLDAQAERGPYARIAFLRPLEGHAVEFEAGYIRHLEWHRQARDSWVWYGWTIWAGERQRWFVYATFGHSSASLDSPVSPAEDERDNILNVLPHAQFLGNALYEYLPGLSRGTGVPAPAARLELTTVDLQPGAADAFEAALGEGLSRPQGETLWYRMAAGGTAPRYVRLRPRPSLSAILEAGSDQALPEKVKPLIARTTVEILNLRPAMSYGLPPAP
ncbi:MAG TPA: hypothetical protein VGX68_07200 [Thermoanaerobaculia bacterium]|jgi:hypothetical protein|nr:hypothetical protein [Thermoanaerobaculia bacterium]